MMLRSVAMLALLLAGACAAPAEDTRAHVQPNVVTMPTVRDVRVSPALDPVWREAITWAFETWHEAVPGLRYSIVVDERAANTSVFGVTSFVVATTPDFADPLLFATTEDGFVQLARTPGDRDGARSVCLHELGHLLFGFGESKDPGSVMYLPITITYHLAQEDIDAARASFLVRDGAP